MKKTWVKRENIYYKPFYKHKSKMFLICIFLLGITFFIYQAFSINQLPSSSTPFSQDRTNLQQNMKADSIGLKIIRGIRLFDFDSYKPNFNGNFACLDGTQEISFTKVNDDYCDCMKDGSDEPSTNACSVGKFYCKYQKRHITGRGRDIFIQSSRINDGICDCCDGSDEWITSINCENRCS